MTKKPIRYNDDVEKLQRKEAENIQKTIDRMRHTMQQSFEITRHATSATHAKSHGIVTGTLTVLPDLPTELAQGMFATPATFEVVLRYASEPGQVDPDTARRARGAALKILDVPGDKLKDGWRSQDFLFNTMPVIGQGDVQTYLKAIEERDKHVGNPQRTRLGTMLRDPSPKEGLFDTTPNISPVAHTYYSQGAFRCGDHVAKFSLAPTSAKQLALRKTKVGKSNPPGVLRDWTRAYFAEHAATYELRVQLCTDLKKMPVEDASVEWSEKKSPYRAVATLQLPAQESFSPARRTYAEDVMSWRPWYSLTAFRPLGSINRVRRRAYEELGAWRHDTNARDEQDPVSLAEVPA